MSNYPSSIDDGTTLPNPLAGSFTNNPDHAILHSTENDAIKAVETKLGTGVSTATNNTLLRGTGSGTTAFSQANLTTDITGTLPVGNGGTGITSLGAGIATFLGTPTSANLATAITDETGSGALVFGTSPNITTPTGIVKGDVGLGNVDNTSDTTKNAASVTLTNKTIDGGSNTLTNIAGSVLTNSSVTASKLSTGAQAAYVATSESTTSTSYADLTTTTDSVTVTIGANGLALVSIYADMIQSTASAFAWIGVTLSGANTLAASDIYAQRFQAFTGGAEEKFGTTLLYTGLSTGSTTFKMKYKVQTGGGGAGTGIYADRRISVIPL